MARLLAGTQACLSPHGVIGNWAAGAPGLRILGVHGLPLNCDMIKVDTSTWTCHTKTPSKTWLEMVEVTGYATAERFTEVESIIELHELDNRFTGLPLNRNSSSTSPNSYGSAQTV